MERETPNAEPLADARRLARLRWRCRRGMLENDLVLSRYLDSRAGAITEDEVAMLDRLLELPDNALWDVIAGVVEHEDPVVAPLVAVLRQPLHKDERTTPKEPRPKDSR